MIHSPEVSGTSDKLFFLSFFIQSLQLCYGIRCWNCYNISNSLTNRKRKDLLTRRIHDVSLFSLFSSNLFKKHMLIDAEHCLYQISNLNFVMQHNRRESGVAARHRKPLNVEILGREWEKFKFSSFLSTFYNFYGFLCDARFSNTLFL